MDLARDLVPYCGSVHHSKFSGSGIKQAENIEPKIQRFASHNNKYFLGLADPPLAESKDQTGSYPALSCLGKYQTLDKNNARMTTFKYIYIKKIFFQGPVSQVEDDKHLL